MSWFRNYQSYKNNYDTVTLQSMTIFLTFLFIQIQFLIVVCCDTSNDKEQEQSCFCYSLDVPILFMLASVIMERRDSVALDILDAFVYVYEYCFSFFRLLMSPKGFHANAQRRISWFSQFLKSFERGIEFSWRQVRTEEES